MKRLLRYGYWAFVFLTLIIAAFLALAFGGPVRAADMKIRSPVYQKAPLLSPVHNWSGINVGVFGAYAANMTDMATTLGTTTSIDLSAIPNGPGFGGILEGLYQASGSPWVWGLETDIDYLNLSRGGQVLAGNTQLLSVNNATNWQGAFNAELGYAIDKVLFKAFGGVAFGGVKPNLSAAGLCLGAPTTSCGQAISDTSVGWDVGGGIDYAVAPTVALFIRGKYTQLGDKSLSIPSAVAGAPPLATSNAQFHIIEQDAGIKFTFGGSQ